MNSTQECPICGGECGKGDWYCSRCAAKLPNPAPHFTVWAVGSEKAYHVLRPTPEGITEWLNRQRLNPVVMPDEMLTLVMVLPMDLLEGDLEWGIWKRFQVLDMWDMFIFEGSWHWGSSSGKPLITTVGLQRVAMN